MNAPAKRAQFNGADQRRRAMLGKVHIAKKQLALADDDYRQILLDETTHNSAADCTEAELARVLARLQRQGFKPLPVKGGKPAAQHPMAKKARALWISLYHLNVVRDPSEKALEAFASRQLGCARLDWANQGEGYRLIEALKDMATRNGWRQRDLAGKPLAPITLHSHLCDVILAKLKAADEIPADRTIDQAMFRLCGIANDKAAPWTPDDYQRVAKALGDKLRQAVGAAL